jgi:urea-proton symporter
MGLLIGGAVAPVAFAITWSKQSKAAAISGSLCGLAAGLTAWLVEAQVYYGEITLASTGSNYATLAGCLAAIMTGLIVSVVVTLIKPDNYDWVSTRAINAEHADLTGVPPSISKPKAESHTDEKDMKSPSTSPDSTGPGTPEEGDVELQPTASRDAAIEDDPSQLRSAYKLACIASVVLPFIVDFLIPIPMFLSHYIFSRGFFIGWVVISFIWVFTSTFISVVLPIWETRNFFKVLYEKIMADVRSR